MNLSVEHVLMFVLVFCAFYYMMNRCGCKEGYEPMITKDSKEYPKPNPGDCSEWWEELKIMSADQKQIALSLYDKIGDNDITDKEAIDYYLNNSMTTQQQAIDLMITLMDQADCRSITY